MLKGGQNPTSQQNESPPKIVKQAWCWFEILLEHSGFFKLFLIYKLSFNADIVNLMMSLFAFVNYFPHEDCFCDV